MSSVLVKGMEMPDSCAVCRFAGKGGYFMERVVCMFTGENEDAKNVDRLPDCPLVALPDKHGELIDRDAFRADYGMNADCADCEKECRGKMKACEYDRIYSKMDFCSWIDDADTIVEAEDNS